MRLAAVTRAIELDVALVDLLPERDGLAWLRGGDGLVGWGQAARYDAGTGRDRGARAAAWLRGLVADAEVDDEVGVPGTGVTAFASLTFDVRTPGSPLLVPAVLVGRRDGTAWVTTIGPPGELPEPGPLVARPQRTEPLERPRYAGASIPDLQWLEAVARATKLIDEGALAKVVLARDHAVWAHAPFDVPRLARRLHQRFPGCFTFHVEGLLGATPELLVRRTGEVIESLTLAGSARRGADAAEDAAIGSALLSSDKDLREHAFAADSVARVLRSRTTELHAPDAPELLALDNVQHLATPFRGRLAGTESALHLADALHPTAAVGGTPTGEAVALIRELEQMDRGRYAGPVGWVDGRGDGELGIALRCAELSGARARLFAGAGIVAGSLPEDELEETRIKLRAVQSALAD